jgi:threonine/homoserine/homoserine lactone efflux protein
LDGLYLLVLGFLVGISGAMMPGPLLVYTVAESLKKGWKTGYYVIIGHAIVEVLLMVLLAAGVATLMASANFVTWISLSGGAYMIYSGLGLHRSRWNLSNHPLESRYGTVVGGMMFTALNPGFPIWWATAGARLLLEGMKVGGLSGAILVFVGHWVADFGYFLLVSLLVAKGRETLLEKYVAPVKKILASALIAIGAYFIWTGL